MGNRNLLIVLLVGIAPWAAAQEEGPEFKALARYRSATIRVRVVDPEGRPRPGVPVAAVFPVGDGLIAAVLGTEWSISRSGVPPLDVVGVTDGTGECTLELAKGGMPLLMIATAIGPRKLPVEVRLRGPFPDAQALRFEMGDLPKATVTLTCPASHALRVMIVQEDGTRDHRPAVVSVGALQEAPSDGRSPRGGLRGIAATARDGLTTFAAVGAGQRIRVAARIEGETKPRFTEVDIPISGGASETTSVVLKPSDAGSDVVLAARLLRPDGRALARLPVVVRVSVAPALVEKEGNDTPPVRSPWIGTKTDADGRIRVPLESIADPDPWVRTTIRVATGPWWPLDALGEAKVVIARGLRRGEDDLGAIRFSGRPVVVSGSVVRDTDSSPVEGAVITVERQQLEIFGIELPEPTAWALQMGFNRWNPVAGIRAVSASDGSFRLRGPVPKGRLQIRCERPGLVQQTPVAVPPGGRETRIIMLPAGGVRGRVLLDEGTPSTSILVQLSGEFERDIRPPPSAPSWSGEGVFELIRNGIEIPVKEDGSFFFPALPEGRAKIAVMVSHVEARVVENIHLHPGAIAMPPELNPADLRGRLVRRRVTVTDKERRPIPGAVVALWDDRMQHQPLRETTDRAGEARFIVLEGGAPMRFSVNGPEDGVWTRVELRNAEAEAAAVLERRPTVTVVLKNPEVLPRPPYYLSCVLNPADAPERSRKGPFGESEWGARLDGTGVGTTSVEKPGRYRVRVMLWAIMPDVGFDLPVKFSGPEIVELRSDGSDRVAISVDAESIAEAEQTVANSLFK